MQKDLTKGNIWKTVLSFSLPFLLSYFLQTLYGLADLFIIGQFCPTEATTAVSLGSQVMHMLTVILVGLAVGGNVLIAKSVGAKNEEQKNKAIGNTLSLFAILSLVLTILLLSLIQVIVRAVNTPYEAVAGLSSYLFVCFLGIPFITAYNVLSSIFRGLGDSKSPMYFIAISCVLNIGLDYLFIGLLHLDVVGAALGTVLSQGTSVLLAMFFVTRKKMMGTLHKKDFLFSSSIMKEIAKVGLPIAIQDGFIQVSFILISAFANLRGLVDSASVGVVEKIIGIFFLVPSTMMSTVSSLSAQNIGANNLKRAKQVLYICLLITICIGTIFSISTQFLSRDLISIFSSDSSVIESGSNYLRSYVWDCIFAGVHFCFSGYFCAIGLASLSFIHNAVSIVLARIPIAYFASKTFESLYPMGWGAPIGSLLSCIICLVAFFIIEARRKKIDFQVI